jgi:uncharacterized RDD family membrane protein YckC
VVAFYIDFCVLAVTGFFLAFPVTLYFGASCFFGGRCVGGGREIVLGAAVLVALVGLPIGYLFFSWWWPGRGRTFGMRSVGIRIAQLQGAPPALRHVGLRMLVWLAVTTPALWVITLALPALAAPLGPLQFVALLLLIACVLVRRDRRGLHDLVAGTIVVPD